MAAINPKVAFSPASQFNANMCNFRWRSHQWPNTKSVRRTVKSRNGCHQFPMRWLGYVLYLSGKILAILDTRRDNLVLYLVGGDITGKFTLGIHRKDPSDNDNESNSTNKTVRFVGVFWTPSNKSKIDNVVTDIPWAKRPQIPSICKHTHDLGLNQFVVQMIL